MLHGIPCATSANAWACHEPSEIKGAHFVSCELWASSHASSQIKLRCVLPSATVQLYVVTRAPLCGVVRRDSRCEFEVRARVCVCVCVCVSEWVS